MGSIDDIMQLCRLCLVKDQVNIPIFDETSDIRQTFVKINQCLPVKVSRDDNLPKKICDGCSYKLDMLYVFRNTSVDSEKQLITWLSQLGSCSLSQSIVKDGVTKPEIMVKQETFEATDVRLEGDNPEMGVDGHQELGVDAHSYIMQQQKLPYQQDFVAFGEASGSTGVGSEEPAPKRAKRTAVKKHVPAETEEDALETAIQITKAEQEEDSDDVDQPDYVEAPSTSADDQPGPSGVGKGTIEAPLKTEGRASLLLFTCDTCYRSFPTGPKLNSHKRAHREKTAKCEQCPKSYTFKFQLEQHIRHTHEEKRPFPCTICPQRLKTRNALKCHILSHTKDYPFKCESCDLGFAEKNALTRHEEVIHKGLRFICRTCKKQFKNIYSLKKHEMKHNSDYIQEIHTCQQCFKVFRTKRAFKEHMARHEGNAKTYVCDMCGKILTTGSSLRDHRMSHTGEKPFVCDVCGKAFVKKQLLIEHVRIHTKEKPYKCSMCDKGFTQKGSLNIHMRHHTGDKPYKCHICTKGFVSGNLLKNHKCKV